MATPSSPPEASVFSSAESLPQVEEEEEEEEVGESAARAQVGATATTISAEEAAAADVATTTATSEDAAESPELLREWASSPSHDPPVAPAVVVEEGTPGAVGGDDTAADAESSAQSNRHFSSYPVANLVRDFVRSTTGVHDALVRTVDQMLPQAASLGMPGLNAGTSSLSVRSEPPTSTVYPGALQRSVPAAAASSNAPTASAATHPSDMHNDPYTVSARTLGDLDDMDDGAEFILVDGDLIAVPPSAVYHANEQDDRGNRHHRRHRNRHYDEDYDDADGGDEYDDFEPPMLRHPKSCRKAGRMQRGFRKVRKFFSRKKQPKVARDEDAGLLEFDAPGGAAPQEEGMASEDAAAPSSPPLPTSTTTTTALEPPAPQTLPLPASLSEDEPLLHLVTQPRPPQSQQHHRAGVVSPPQSPRSSFSMAATATATRAAELAPHRVPPTSTLHEENPVAKAAAAKAPTFRRQRSIGDDSGSVTTTSTTASAFSPRKEKRKHKVSWKKQQQPSTAPVKTSLRWGSARRNHSTNASATAATGPPSSTLLEEGDQKPRSRPTTPNTNRDGLQNPPATSSMPRQDPLLAPPTGQPFYNTGAAAASAAAPYDALYQGPPPPAAASAAAAATPPNTPFYEGAGHREQSVTASFVGTADEPSVFLDAGMVLPAAEAFIEGYYNPYYGGGDYGEEKLKRDDAIPASLVPTDTDYKVDKEHAPDVEAMLWRAEQEALTDLDLSSSCPPSDGLSTPRRKRGKTTGISVPLSQACPSDDLVHNDSLKVVLVGSAGVDKSSLARAIRESTKKPRPRKSMGVEVHTWTASDIRFHLWDVQGASTTMPLCKGNSNGATYFGSPGGSDRSTGGYLGHESSSTPNYGAHPGTQSLFFSSQSLYLLVWDLACNNPHTHPVLEDDSDDDDDHGGNDWSREEANKQADRALCEDIETRVLSWVDRIARRGPRSAILPVGLIPDEMSATEAQRRCKRLYELLEARMAWYENSDRAPNIVLDDSKNILCVNYSRNYGIEQLQETMVAIATDTTSGVFTHVATPVPPGVVEVMDLLRRLKADHKLIWVDHIIGELGSSVPVDDVINALHFLSSIGEILYFGTEEDEMLSQFVILSRKWLVSAISCILRNNWKQELTDSRRFMQMQCLYSEQEFAENDVTRVLGSGAASSCPLLSGEDAKMLWQSMNFMREAADRYWQLNESSASAPTMFHFLERLLVNCGIFLPLGMSNYGQGAGMERDEVYFVPSLLTQNDPGDVWTSKDIWSYRNQDSFLTTLCHSWLFRDGAPSDLFDHLTVALLKDVYAFTKAASASLNPREVPQRSQTVPLGHNSMQDFMENHQGEAIGSVRIQQIVCWNSALLLKVATVFPDVDSNQLKETSVEIFVTIVDQNSTYCVASDAMRGNMQRVIVSGKGPIGHNGRKLFKGGYQAVIDSVQKTVDDFNNVNMQIICPTCLANGDPRRAGTWSYEEVLASSEERSGSIVCRRGHRISSGLLTGQDIDQQVPGPLHALPAPRSVADLLPSVVLIGLWDTDNSRITNVGSGFIADKKYGLIVTAGHILFDMADGKNYGAPYFGLANAKVVVGVIPDGGNDTAVFRYFAEIIADDVRSNVDACVLRITSRLGHDVDDEGAGIATKPDILLDPQQLKEENLVRLKMELNFQLEESIRIIGYNQGGEGIFEPGSHILRSADLAKGFICRMFTAAHSDESDSDSDSENNTFAPREEIVAICPTISGHSGGPCVNGDGLVIGILSRADPVDRNRCYLVPATQLKALLKRARNVCSRPVYPTKRPSHVDRASSM